LHFTPEFSGGNSIVNLPYTQECNDVAMMLIQHHKVVSTSIGPAFNSTNSTGTQAIQRGSWR